MAASAVMSAGSAQAGCQLLSTSFRKESTSTSCGDMLEASSQTFLGSPRSMARLRGAAVPRQTSRPVSATSASLFSMIPGNFMVNVQEDDVKKDLAEDDDEDENLISSSSELLDTVNSVMADVVDGQKYLKETGRTKPRPMKRRSLVVCLAMGAIQPYLSDIENRMGNLRRTTSSSLAKTVRLASQLSFGASRAVNYIAEEERKSEAEQVSEVENRMGNLLRTTSSSLAKTVRLASQLSFGASRAVNYIAEEERKSEAEQVSGVENRMGNLLRTTSSSLAKTVRLVSQLSYGASRAVNYIAEEQRKSESEQLILAAA